MKAPAYNQYDRRAVSLIMVLTTLIFGAMLVFMLNVRKGDYAPHLQFAQGLHDGTLSPTADPLFHILVLIPYNLFPAMGLVKAGLITTLTIYVLIGITIFALYIRPALSGVRSGRIVLVAVFFVLALMLLSAITIPSWPTHNLYWGYFVPNAYHNPTIVVLRLFALLLFVRVVEAFAVQEQPASLRKIVITASLTILAALAKPNYIIALIPGVILAGGFSLLRRDKTDWRHLVWGVILPGILITVIQIVFLPETTGDGTGGSVIFAPFALANQIPQSYPLLPKFFLSVLFPLAVYGFYFTKARTHTSLNLAWVVFLIGAFYTYTLVEANRITHGNFIWSGQITVFMLFVASGAFFLQQIYTRQDGFKLNRPALICLLVLGLHILSGLLWYYTEITTVTEARWW